MGADSGINLVNAIERRGIRTLGRGVLGVLNDEIHFSRDMTKTSTTSADIQSPDFSVMRIGTKSPTTGCRSAASIKYESDVRG